MADLKQAVDYYVARLSGAEREDAWHRLAEAGPAALLHVIAAFQATGDVGVHVNLVRVLAEYGTADAVPFLVGLLVDAEEPVWKSALDALVTIGGGTAVEALAKARAAAPLGQRQWIDEAIDQAVASLIELADVGDAAAQVDLGIMYAEGVGVREDYTRARTYLQQGAEQGHAEAQYYLGTMSDDEEAVEWFRKAAEQGHVPAQFALAWRYEGAGGVGPDAEQAVSWLRRAAEQGHTDAQRLLAGHYASGDGVEQDYEQALKWIRLAAESGNELAQFELGEMYATGRGMPRDDEQGAIWRCKAAEHGGAFVQYQLAARYADGSPEAREAMDRAMQPEQRARVRKVVRGWVEDFESRSRE